MTHDELLNKMYLPFKNAEDAEFFALSKYRTALRAVVELHKPQEITLPNGEWGTNCVFCDDGYEYPCPTIQAIEKELS
jgi:hypothetical protein